MNRQLYPFFIAMLLLASLAVQADEGEWYISPSIVYFDDDGDRKIDDSIAGGQIQFGKMIRERLGLEGLLGSHDIEGFPGQEHLEIGFNAIRKFRPDSRFSPYLIAGLGYLRADVGLPSFGGLPPAGETSSGGTASAGFGFKVDIGDSPWALRTEWRFRHAFDSEGLTDQLTSVGLQYSFGGGAEPLVSRAVSEPEPVGYLDRDGDGVTDDRDRCPDSAAGVEVDLTGCEVEVKIEFSNIYFGFDSDVIHPASRRLLDKAASILLHYSDLQIEIAGYADTLGSERYNEALSVRRAEAVRQYLEQAGVNTANLKVHGYGESRSANLAENRRVELRVTNR